MKIKLIRHIVILHAHTRTQNNSRTCDIYTYFFGCLLVLCLFVDLFICLQFCWWWRRECDSFLRLSLSCSFLLPIYSHISHSPWRRFQQASAMYHSLFRFFRTCIKGWRTHFVFLPSLSCPSVRMTCSFTQKYLHTHRRYHRIVFDGPSLFILLWMRTSERMMRACRTKKERETEFTHKLIKHRMWVVSQKGDKPNENAWAQLFRRQHNMTPRLQYCSTIAHHEHTQQNSRFCVCLSLLFLLFLLSFNSIRIIHQPNVPHHNWRICIFIRALEHTHFVRSRFYCFLVLAKNRF